ncbi:MAG: GspE/PulE family protein [Armatimonadota bacterium]
MREIASDEHVFRGRGAELHVAPEGLALTGAVAEKLALGSGTSDAVLIASWDEVSAVEVTGAGRRRGLVLSFRDERPVWEVPGLPLHQAEWGQTLLEEGIAERLRRFEPNFEQRLELGAIQRSVADLLGRPEPRVAHLLDLILVQAAHHEASDVHFEPLRGSFKVRFRLNGVLVDILALPTYMQGRILARLKVLAGLTIFRRDRPQEGRALTQVAGRGVDLRVTILPTLHGEKATIRIFDERRAAMPLNSLGFTEQQEGDFREFISRPQGTILLTGPSASGKTTTMYSALMHLHETQCGYKGIATVEDPVEFDLAVLNQTQVDKSSGLTFAAGLRTVLRQDPEVIMIGEIRDRETAEIAIQAGLTGHLVFSTVHARSAAGVFTRLMDMGVEPYLLASSVTAVLSQRLVRLNCDACAAPAEPDAALAAQLGPPPGAYRVGPGCEACYGTGYAGRTAIFELLKVTGGFREAVLRKAPAGELEDLAGELSGQGLLEVGLQLAGRGRTTLEELRRVLGPKEADS